MTEVFEISDQLELQKSRNGEFLLIEQTEGIQVSAVRIRKEDVHGLIATLQAAAEDPEPTEITGNDDGYKRHPSWGMVQLHRVTGQVNLFDSSIPHSEFVRLTIHPAERKRDLHRDWVHGLMRPYIEIDMSLSQWGQAVSSFGTSGTPCTLRYLDGERIPEPSNDEPRLAVTAREVKDTTTKALADLQAAIQAVEDAFARKAGRVELGKLLNDLHYTVGNLPANMAFAAKSLTEHAETVVAKATVDIEAERSRVAAERAQLERVVELANGIVNRPRELS